MTTIPTNKPGERLKLLIKKNGYTQEQFANIIGIGLTQLKECISGKKALINLSYDILETMSRKLNVDIGYLIGTNDLSSIKSNTLYGFIKCLPNFHIECNPINEDQIYIKYEDMELYTDIQTLENKVKESLLFHIFLENQK